MDIKLSVGEKIEFRFQLSDGSYSSSYFVSVIEEIVSENKFFISEDAEIDCSKWLGRVIRVMLPRKDGAYIAEGIFTKQKMIENNYFLLFEVSRDFTKVQRREFPRVKAELDLSIFGYGDAKTFDISGNGMAFLSELNYDVGENVTGWINLEGKSISFNGIVVRNQDVSEMYNLVCLYFSEISSDNQGAIIKFVNSNKEEA